MPGALTKRWNRWRNPWDREYAMRGQLWRGGEEASWLGTHLPPGSRLAELGCGDGKFLAALQAAGHRPVGLDFSRRALRLTSQRVACPLVLGDVRNLGLRPASLDAVVARFVLGALDEADRVVAAQELAGSVRPSGCALLEEFSRADFRYGQGREVEPHTFERNRGISTHYFVAEELAGLFPAWRPRLLAPVEHVQRTRDGPARRSRWRLVLEKPAYDLAPGSNSSSRGGA